nr:RNA-directed DNA polymerase, eukaryota, reverse transcriptase zinc-binding domain protein [Tanacetum cinerariifolium]
MEMGLVRPPRGRAFDEVENLKGLLSMVNLQQNHSDAWKWSLDSKGEFSVKSVTKWVDERQIVEHCIVSCEVVDKVSRKLWNAVLRVAGYLIWKRRNDRVFRGNSVNIVRLFQDIQLKSYEWINRRSKSIKFEWEKWIVRPQSCSKVQLVESDMSFLCHLKLWVVGLYAQFEKYFVFRFLLPLLCVNMSAGFLVDGGNRFLGQSFVASFSYESIRL